MTTLPAPILLTPTSRYIPAGVRRYTWVPLIAVKGTPTVSELAAGTDLTPEIAAVSGFMTTSATVDAPDAGSRFTSKTAGRITSDNSTLTIYASQTGTDVRSLLTRNLTGFIVIYPEGIAATKTCDVFPVTIIGAPKSQDLENNATLDIEFTVTSIPVEGIPIPTGP